MKIFLSKTKLTKDLKREKDLGFVPTMGSIHLGHISLIKRSMSECSKSIVSIFVNKPQFNRNKDFKIYPRTIKRDISTLRKLKVDYLYIPRNNQIYPDGINKNIKLMIDKKLSEPEEPSSSEETTILLNLRSDMSNIEYKDFIDLNYPKFSMTPHEYDWLQCHAKSDWLPYLIHRYKFKMYPTQKTLTNFPVHLLIEPTPVCNLRCIMCFQIDKSFSSDRKHVGYMEWNLFKSAIDQAADHQCHAITLASRGEPTLHKRFGEMLSYINEKGLLDVKINTNATRLDEKLCHDILSANVSTVTLSVDAADKSGLSRLWAMLKGITANQYLAGIALGVLVNLMGVPLPLPVLDVLQLISQSAAPCALFALGAALSQYRIAGAISASITISILKTLVFPAVVWLVTDRLLDLDPLWQAVLVLLAALPVGINTYLFAEQYRTGVPLAAASTVLSTGLSMITISIILGLIELP